MKALYTRKGLHLAVAVLAAVLVSSACFAAPDGLSAVTMVTPEQILATSLGMFAAAGITKRMRSLSEKKGNLVKEARAIVDAAEAEGRELTEEEAGKYDALMAQIEGVNKDMKREEQLAEQERTAQAVELPGGPISGGRPRLEDDPRRGFAHLGEFATSVRMAMRRASPVIDERLTIGAAAPSTAANEAVGEEGGYTVPPEFRTEIMAAVDSEESLFRRTDQTPISRNSIKMPIDEVSDWDTSSGIQAYWEDELDAITASKPKLKEVEFNARKVTALVPVSSELLEDSTAMDAFLRRKAPAKIGFKVDLAIVRGTGAGQPLGFLNSGALITVAKESGQAADTVVRANINKMWMRMPANRRRTAIWLVNQDIEAQLQELQFVGTESPVPLYMPNGGLSATPFDTLKGRPVIYHQAASTLGDVGDISLVDLSQYGTVVKRGGVRVDVSMHLYFDADAMAYRFILRIGGHPYLSAPIQPRVGSNTLSPFVTLAERA